MWNPEYTTTPQLRNLRSGACMCGVGHRTSGTRTRSKQLQRPCPFRKAPSSNLDPKPPLSLKTSKTKRKKKPKTLEKKSSITVRPNNRHCPFSNIRVQLGHIHCKPGACRRCGSVDDDRGCYCCEKVVSYSFFFLRVGKPRGEKEEMEWKRKPQRNWDEPKTKNWHKSSRKKPGEKRKEKKTRKAASNTWNSRIP